MKNKKDKIGLIGVGNMGAAIIEGLLDKNGVNPNRLYVYDKVPDKAAVFAAKTGVNLSGSVKSIIKNCDSIILAIKPQDLPSLSEELDFSELKPKGLKDFRCIISILAGTPLAKLEEHLPKGYFDIVRAMPNLGAQIGKSVTAITSKNHGLLGVAQFIFSGCGEVIQLDEKHFDLVTAISGSGPAYFFLLMELLIKAGKENGLSEKQAQLLAVQTAVGSALLAASSDLTPAELRERVTSKKGTTDAALKVFKRYKLDQIVSKAVKAAMKRGKELAKG